MERFLDLMVRARITKMHNRPAMQKDFAAEMGLNYLPCAAGKKGGVPGARCKKPAGWGTDHLGVGPCKLHGGNLPSVVKRAAVTMMMEEMRASQGTLGADMPVDIHPADALLELVKMCAGHVRWLNMQVADLSRISEFNMVSKTQEIHSTVRLLGEYEDRLARFCKLALDTGIEERLVRVAEKQGDMIAIMLVDLFSGLDLTLEQKELVPGLVSRGLAQLSAGDAGFVSVLDATGTVVE